MTVNSGPDMGRYGIWKALIQLTPQAGMTGTCISYLLNVELLWMKHKSCLQSEPVGTAGNKVGLLNTNRRVGLRA